MSDDAFRKGAASDQNELINATGTSGNTDDRSMLQKAQDAFSGATSKAQESISSATGSTGNTTVDGGMPTKEGGFVDEIKKTLEGKDAGGNQLFDHNEHGTKAGEAGQGFLKKYGDESAPGESTA